MSWAELARTSAVALMTGVEREDDSVTATLIRDISDVFAAHGDEPMKTSDVLEGLYRIEESPWGDWFGKPLSAHGLSRLLKAYRIKTMSVWSDAETVRGYKVDQFEDAFAQLSVRSVRSVRSEARSHATPNAPNAPNASTREQGEDAGDFVTPSQDVLDERPEGWLADKEPDEFEIVAEEVWRD